jgi:hypothetical protein
MTHLLARLWPTIAAIALILALDRPISCRAQGDGCDQLCRERQFFYDCTADNGVCYYYQVQVCHLCITGRCYPRVTPPDSPSLSCTRLPYGTGWQPVDWLPCECSKRCSCVPNSHVEGFDPHNMDWSLIQTEDYRGCR